MKNRYIDAFSRLKEGLSKVSRLYDINIISLYWDAAKWFQCNADNLLFIRISAGSQPFQDNHETALGRKAENSMVIQLDDTCIFPARIHAAGDFIHIFPADRPYFFQKVDHPVYGSRAYTAVLFFRLIVDLLAAGAFFL